MLAVVAVLASCGGDESSQATPTPAAPAATATPAPETPTPTATAEVVSTPTPVPTPTVEASPTAPDLVIGEPRDLPAGFALFYRVGPCYDCGFGLGDVRRAVFDKAAGVLREERLFTNLAAPGCPGLPLVSESGRELAVVVDEHCVDDPPRSQKPDSPENRDSRIKKPSLWFSADVGETWEPWGPLAVGTDLVEVAREDVVVLEEGRLRWFQSGEEIPPPSHPDALEFRAWNEDGPVWAGPNEVFLNARGERVGNPQHDSWGLLGVTIDVDAEGSAPPLPLRTVVRVGDNLVLAEVIGRPLLVDLSTGTAHPLKGLPVAEEGAHGSMELGEPAYYFPFKVVPLAAD